jgi:hypothetical protein
VSDKPTFHPCGSHSIVGERFPVNLEYLPAQ